MGQFDATSHIIRLKGKEYLEVKWRLVWFRTEHPAESGWAIVTQAEEVTDTSARYRALIVDPEGRTVATGTKTETKSGFGDFVEKAETGSIGRALALLGYGTQFAGEDLDEGARIVDSPVERPQAQPAAAPTPRPANDGLKLLRNSLNTIGITSDEDLQYCRAQAQLTAVKWVDMTQDQLNAVYDQAVVLADWRAREQAAEAANAAIAEPTADELAEVTA